jgi:enoyl-CoA hydratase/carnithine racemase
MSDNRSLGYASLSLADYQDKYELLEIERRDGIIQVTCDFNNNDTSSSWMSTIGNVSRDISLDPENRVMILTGKGDAFNTNHAYGPMPMFENMDRWAAVGGIIDSLPRWLTAFIDIPIPTIAAVNGPATVHAEYAALCNIVLASPNATFQDSPHFINNIPPGDGVHVVWPLLLGWTRGSYFLLRGQTLTAEQALQLGVVNEVVARDQLLPRAWEIAEELNRQDHIVLYLTKKILNHQLKKLLQDNLIYGLGLEGYGIVDVAQRAAKREFAD